MVALPRSSKRLTVAEVGQMIAVVLAGVVISIVVTLTGTPAEVPADAERGTIEVIRTGESWGHVAPAIAEVDLEITTDA